MKSKKESIRYVAFLCAINVGGRFVKMDALTKMFSSFGFKNVKTFIQSGNVVFDSEEMNTKKIEQKIEQGLAKKLGYEVATMVRTLDEFKAMVKRNPFKTISRDAKISVAFMSDKPKDKMKLPLFSAKKDVEIFEINDRDAFCVHHLINGQWGYPNQFIEKALGVKTTVRFWSAIIKLMEFTESTFLNSPAKKSK
ncbi:MAG: DUF1697 domain-containing protein [Chitinophagales bacterium]